MVKQNSLKKPDANALSTTKLLQGYKTYRIENDF